MKNQIQEQLMRRCSPWIIMLALATWGNAASAAVLTNFTYTYDGTVLNPSTHNGNYPDDTGFDLNDNAALSVTFSDPVWVGTWRPGDTVGTVPQPRIDLTFSSEILFDSLTILYLTDISNGGIHAPSQVDLSFSSNGITYSAPTSFFGFDDTGLSAQIKTNVLNLTGFTGQYVRAEFYPTAPLPGSWVFLGELDFAGTVIPEPSSGLLGLAGGLVLLLRRRCGV